MNIVCITPYPSGDSRHESGVAHYSKMLIENMAENDVSILSPRSSVGVLSLLPTILAKRPRVVHMQHETFLYGGALSLLTVPLLLGFLRLCKVHTIVTLHHTVDPSDITPAFCSMHETRIPAWVIRSIYHIFYRMMRVACSQWIVHEEAFKTTMHNAYGMPESRIATIPHGIEDPRKQNVQRATDFGIPRNAETIFGFFGFIADYKGLSTLLDAFETHIKNHPTSHLLVGGDLHPRHKDDAAFREKMEQLLQRAKSMPNVTVHGFVADQHVGAFFNKIDCLVLPYKMNFGASGPLALATGSHTAVLAAQCLSAIVPEESLYGITADHLAAALTTYATERKVPQWVEERCTERTWEHAAQSTLAIYNKRDILVIGAYGQDNLGDELLLHHTLSLLPTERCTVTSQNPKQTQDAFGVHTVHSQKGILQKIRAVLRARTIVVGGGDQLKILKPIAKRWQYSLLLQYAILSVACRLLGKKFLFLCIGIGNIRTPFACFLAKRILNNTSLTIVREKRSLKKANTLAPHANVVHGCDLAFSQEPLSPRKKPESLTLGIAATAGIDNPQHLQHVLQEIAKTIDTLSDQYTNLSIVLLPFQEGHQNPDDTAVAKRIRDLVSSKQNVSIQRNLSVSDIADIYTSLDICIGMRLHSIILSCLYSVPFVACIYDEKVEHFVESIGSAAWSVPCSKELSAEELTEKCTELLTNHASIQEHLYSEAKTLHTLSTESLKHLPPMP